MTEVRYPWQYTFPPFFTLQPHAETRSRQIAAWRTLILEHCGATGTFGIDARDAPSEPPFSNQEIGRSVRPDLLEAILNDLERTGHAAPTDSSRHRWDIYRSTLAETAKLVRSWVIDNGMTGTVCTLFELSQGDDTVDEPFHGVDVNVLAKALQILAGDGFCELIESDDGFGVKFF